MLEMRKKHFSTEVKNLLPEQYDSKTGRFNSDTFLFKHYHCFAYQCALRTMPFIGHGGNFDFWPMQDRQKNIYCLFKALDIVGCVNQTKTKIKTKVDSMVPRIRDRFAFIGNLEFNELGNYKSGVGNFKRQVMICGLRLEDNVEKKCIKVLEKTVELVQMQELDLLLFRRELMSIACEIYDIACELDQFEVSDLLKKDLKELNYTTNPHILDGREYYGPIWDNFQTALVKEGCAYWANLCQNSFNQRLEKLGEDAYIRLKVPNSIQEQGACAVAKYLESNSQKTNYSY